MKITFIAPRLQSRKFTGGIYCILRHANELKMRGHDVTVVAYPKSEKPQWIDLKAKLIIPNLYQKRNPNGPLEGLLARLTHTLGYIGKKYNGGVHYIAAIEQLLKSEIPESDITIATLWETARLVAKYGSGQKAYFCQHFESVFFEDAVEKAEVAATYHYGLNLIANSSWLQSKIWRELQKIDSMPPTVHLVNNGIDSSIFNCNLKERAKRLQGHLRIISYGGRDAIWKGFEEMARSMAVARAACPRINIEWNVYGEALLPPNNPIAAYNDLGFLAPHELAAEYAKHDVLLSASWSESFPLFPLEAMACGLAVVTTKAGTEDYTIDNRNCILVEARNIESISAAIIRLATNQALTEELGREAATVATSFGWGRASQQMEDALRKIVAAANN